MIPGGILVGVPYLYDGVGARGANLDLLQLIAAVMKALKAPWVLAGDFNMTPDELQASGWPKLACATIVSPKGRVGTTRTIDFLPSPIPWRTRCTPLALSMMQGKSRIDRPDFT